MKNKKYLDSYLVFLITFILTFIIVRICSSFYDPNPLLFGFELHHFYYGICLLFVSLIFCILNQKIFMILSAISTGFMSDELIYVIRGAGNHQIYLSSLAYAITTSLIIIIVVLIMRVRNNSIA